MTYSLRSKARSSSRRALRPMNTWRTTGWREAAVAPSDLPSTGTVRPPSTRWPLLEELLREERVRDLQQDAGPVTGVWLVARRAAMAQIHQHGQRLAYYRVRFSPVHVGHEANSAGIVFGTRVVKGVFQQRRVRNIHMRPRQTTS